MRTNWSANDPIDSERLPQRSLRDLARRALRVLPLGVLIFLAVAGALIFGLRFVPFDYRSTAELMITARDGDITRATSAVAVTRSSLVDTGVAQLSSPAMLERISAQLRQKAKGHAPGLASLAGGVGGRLRARRRGESYLVDVDAQAVTPEAAQAIVQAAIETYQDGLLDLRFADLGPDRSAVVKPSTSISSSKAQAEAALASLESEKAGLLTALPAAVAAPSIASDAHQALARARQDAAALRALLRSEVTAADLSVFRASGAEDRLGDEGAAFVRELLVYGASLEAGSSGPAQADEAKFHKYQVLTEATRLATVLDARVTTLASASATPAPIATPRGSAEATARLKALDMQIEAQRKLVEATAAALAAISPPATTPGKVDFDLRVVSNPSPGMSFAMRHALLLNAGAISLALTLGLSFMLIATLSSNTVINSADASALAGTPLVVPLPRITSREMNRLPPGERRPANFATEQPASAFADGIRRTLSGVLPSDGQTGGTCVAVTGTDVGSGASTIAIALARLAAARGARVLLIDTDFEEAGATRAMGIEPAAGIEAILSGDCQLADLVVEDDLTSVHLLPCLPGRAGRAALSLSQLTALKAAIAVARTGYDLVVIDCKPFATRSAVRSLSRMADSALLVSAYGNTRRDRLGVLARRTRQNGATICGVVFNLVPSNNRRKLFAFDSTSSGNPLPEPPSPTFNGGLEAAQEVRIIH